MTLRPRLATGLPFHRGTSGLWRLSVFAGCELDRTCVHELGVKIQVVQLRRVLLLFALVLGLSAIVAALAPPPSERNEEREPAGDPPLETAAPVPAAPPPAAVSITVPGQSARRDTPVTRRAASGSRLSLTVRVPETGDVVIDSLGLRRSADPLAPARLDLLALPPGRHAVAFEPVRGPPRVVARLVFAAPRTVRPPRPGR